MTIISNIRVGRFQAQVSRAKGDGVVNQNELRALRRELSTMGPAARHRAMEWLNNADPRLAQALRSNGAMYVPGSGAIHQDASSGAAVESLKKQPQPVSGRAMEDAIKKATKDPDNQAAGKEYADLKNYAEQNWDKLSPDAKEKFRVYEKYAQAAQAKGQTGISAGQYDKMLKEMKGAGYKDLSSGAAIETLKSSPKPVSGDAMMDAIRKGTVDADNQAAGKEFADFQKYAKENWNDLSPEAKARFQVYEKYAQSAQAKGQTGISQNQWNKMMGEMRTTGYQDKSAGAAIENLKSQPQPISGEAMDKAIRDATKDLDNQAAGKEYADLKKFASENWDKLSPDAKAKFGVYEKYAQHAQSQGKTGIDIGSYNKMLGEMKTAGYQDSSSGAAVEELKKQPQPVSGEAMQEAIRNATRDLDGQAAGKEYADLKKYASENWDKLSPDAKAKFEVYEQYAQAAQAKGETGIDAASYARMMSEMGRTGYKDAGAGQVIENLKAQPQPISGEAMEQAIHDATKDLDNQAAGAEYADLKKFANANWDKLSPDAKAKFAIYEKYAHQAQSQGKTGMDPASYSQMLNEMKHTGYQDKTSGAAVEHLKQQPQPISGEAMEKAIRDATMDPDNQAAGKEYADLKKYASENWDKLSPDAKAKFGVYEKYAQHAQAQGKTGIDIGSYNKMLGEMKTAGYTDQGAGAAIEDLKKQPQPVSGDAMAKAIENATKDLDNQAAGKEYADLKKYASENWDKLSPDAQAKFGIYEKYAQQAQAQGKTGIDTRSYNKMLSEMRATGYQDATAGGAIEDLKKQPQPISGDAMDKAIRDATKDLDNQAAGKEYADLKKFASENWDKLSPDAKAKFGVYEKYAQQAQSKGKTGIDIGSYNKMLEEMKTAGYKDQGAGTAIEDLKQQPRPISGDAMDKAIRDATKDLDNQAAGKEYADLKKFASENWDSLSPEAKAKFGVYEKYAQQAQAQGKTGIDIGSYNKMLDEMKLAGYKDKTSGAAVEELKKQPVPISGDAMGKAIEDATKDLDNQAAGKEFADLKKFASENWDKLSPEAKAKFGIYEKYAQQAQAQGKTGISTADYDKMLKEMKLTGYQDRTAGAAVEELKKQPQPVSGDAMAKAIEDATKDLDNQAAGKEYADLKKYAVENWDKLSPDAKAKFGVYEKYAQQAQAQGKTGISTADYDKMLKEMKSAGYQDATSGAAVENLKRQPEPVSGGAMEKAIRDATKDLDNQAAGKEFADLKKWASENWDKLSPDAKAKFGVYEQYAQQAQAKGKTGIDTASYNRMLGDMRKAGYQDVSAGEALEKLKQQGQPVSGKAMEEAILSAIGDLDNQAAGREFADIKKYATENWDKLSPDAKAKFRVYEKYAKAAQAKGQTGIDLKDFARMNGEMARAGYLDGSAGAALEALLDKGPVRISAASMDKAIRAATADFDNSAASTEYADVKRFAQANWERMSPGARKKFEIYERYAQEAQAKGQKGISAAEYQRMLNEMAKVRD